MNALLVSIAWCCVTVLNAAPDYPVQPVPFTNVRLTAGLLARRQATNALVTMPFALSQCETSKRLMNFDLAAETLRRRAAGESSFQNEPPTQFPFDDSDVYKAIEGAAFCLSVQSNGVVAAQLEGMVRRIAAAQEPDGYLYTWRTMHPDSPAHSWIHQQRWLNDPQVSHELYNLGHLYEAGVAYWQATSSRSLLNICLKSAELVQHDLGTGTPRIAPGHQVIEMGLVKLYRETGDQRWLTLAKLFLDARGAGSPYSQDHLPVVNQREAIGHAVRANYLYSGMADVAALTGDDRYLAAITHIWENVVGRKLHLTGGCGARANGEAYGSDYELPNRCYNETCAAVAFLFWNHRMFLMTGDSKYMDVFERTLYNAVLSGVSLSGDRFFYPNPLEYDGKALNNHGHAGRAPWFGCACCPPNILRTLASLGGYCAAVQGEKLYVNLYAESETVATVNRARVKLQQATRYPWDGTVSLRLTVDQPTAFTLALRIPGWVGGRPLPSDLYNYDDAQPADWNIRINEKRETPPITKGFAEISRVWESGDTVTLHFAMPVRRVAGNSHIAATRGLVALERGPVVYAFEGSDNDGSVFDIVLPTDAKIQADYRPNLLDGITVLTVENGRKATRAASGEVTGRAANLMAIPYATWANRGPTPMAVWVARELTGARVPPKPTLASKANIRTSFHRGGMDPAHLNDQLSPLNGPDGSAPDFDFWPHKGSAEWITYEFTHPEQVRAVTLFWFDDTGTGDCRLPSSYSISYLSERGEWRTVENASGYPIRKTDPVRVNFTPVTTTALRLEIQLPPNFSVGLYEWQVE